MSIRKLHSQQNGIASFIIVFSIMLVLSLIVLGFSRLMQREQRQTLDRNLSSRAYYAAESGINMAVKAIEANPAYQKTSCEPDGTITNYVIDSVPANNTELTCLIVDAAPTNVEYSDVSANKSTVVPLDAGADSIRDIQFEWENTTVASPASYTCSAAAAGSFAASGSWTCNAPVLRVDIVSSAGSFARASLVDNTMTVFFYPTNAAAGSAVYSTGVSNKGVVVRGNCTDKPTSPDCTASISGLNSSTYAIRMMSLYGDAKVRITPTKLGGTSVNLRGVQALIDSTGRAQDQLRRIQVRKSLSRINDLVPDFAIQAASGLCKRIYVVNSGGASNVVVDPSAPAGICAL